MNKKSGIVGYSVILGVMFLLSVLILLLLSAFMLKGMMNRGLMNGGVIASYIISCLAGGFLMGQFQGRHKFLWGILMGGSYFLILFLVGRTIYRVQEPTVFHIVSSLAICVISGMFGGMLAPRVQK